MSEQANTPTDRGRPLTRSLAHSLIRSGPRSLLLLLAVAVFLPACQKALFAGEQERTPFDSYDRRRGQEASSYVWDPFQQRRPNLRQRLLPKD